MALRILILGRILTYTSIFLRSNGTNRVAYLNTTHDWQSYYLLFICDIQLAHQKCGEPFFANFFNFQSRMKHRQPSGLIASFQIFKRRMLLIEARCMDHKVVAVSLWNWPISAFLGWHWVVNFLFNQSVAQRHNDQKISDDCVTIYRYESRFATFLVVH